MEDPMEVSPENTLNKPPQQNLNEDLPSVLDHEQFANKCMTDMQLEVEDFEVYHWDIKDWKSLNRRTTGPEFDAGGWKWRILLFPAGNNVPEQISVYLDFADPQGAPEGWHVCAQFALVISNPHNPNIYIFHQAHHRFTIEESDWGFTRFVDFRKAFDGHELQRPLIENGETRISVFVRVMKDTTGVLWHNFVNYDSKKETGYVGLNNQGATCYMNSILQSLYYTNYFRKAVYQIPTEKDEPSKSMALALQRVFYNLQFSDQAVGTTELTKSFGWDSLDSFMQHDVQEFNRVLQDHLEAKMKNTPADGAIDRLFVGKMKSYIKCINVDYESSRIENYYDIQLNVKGCKTLMDSFKEYIAEETLEGDNKYMAEGYGLQDAKKGVSFLSFPPVLHLQLKRFEYDIQRDMMVKINDRYEFPFEIDLGEFLAPEADRSKPHKYHLHGVLVHSGDLHGGHYFALIKPEKDGKWFKFDDDRVIPVTDKEVLEDNYGGELIQATPLSTNLRTSLRTLKRFTNAYMLVYIRESEMDNILAPVGADDIPPHLKTRIEAEKLALEARRREREEMHLYVTCRVITEQTFRRHHGFDLANFDDKNFPLSEVTEFRVLKTERYTSFKKSVATHFSLPPEKIRLWVMVNRQNKTIRPDSCIPENDAVSGLTMETVRDKMASRTGDLKLYLEYGERPLNERMMFPPEGSNYILIFIKYFNLETQTIEGICHMYVLKNSKVGDILPQLRERLEFPPNTPLLLFEEIKPTMIEAMNPKNSFSAAEIQDGDIICVQKDISPAEAAELEISGRCTSAKKHYEFLATRLVVQFKPKIPSKELPEFELTLSNRSNYDDVAKAVALRLGVADPMKIRFTTASQPLHLPKTVVRRTPYVLLAEMLGQTIGGPRNSLLFYEVLDISILELENKRYLTVSWMGSNLKEESSHDLLLPKAATVDTLLKELSSRVKCEGAVRIVEVIKHRISRILRGDEFISDIPEQAFLYAEQVPSEEQELSEGDRIIDVVHFHRDPHMLHGLPFRFLARSGEMLEETLKRLQARLGMGEKEFAKVRVAVLRQGGGVTYLGETEEDDEGDKMMKEEVGVEAGIKKADSVILAELEVDWRVDVLGLDHPGRTARAKNGGLEKAIFIRG
ncbi:uncharacterized protein VTP21DRAFT_6509 [Calcarisporiella thermophila]|uniref:uncharacterized protein n=1 Tax=Calcarisporiella thermophila TaxID=911321 RepID=UPI003742A793